MGSKPQKGKDGKRPRKFHRGRAQGHVNEKRMKTELNPAYARADADRELVERMTKDAREQRRDWETVLEQLNRVAPFVPSWDFSL